MPDNNDTLSRRAYAANALVDIFIAGAALSPLWVPNNLREGENLFTLYFLPAIAATAVCWIIWIRHSRDRRIQETAVRRGAKPWFNAGVTGYLLGDYIVPDPVGFWCTALALGLLVPGGMLWLIGPVYPEPRPDSGSHTGIDSLLPWMSYRDLHVAVDFHPDWWARLYDGIDGPRKTVSALESLVIPEERKSAQLIRDKHPELTVWSDKAICHAWRLFSWAFYRTEWLAFRSRRYPEFLLYIGMSEQAKEPLADVPLAAEANLIAQSLWSATSDAIRRKL